MSAIDRLIAAAFERARSLRVLAGGEKHPVIKRSHQSEAERWSGLADNAKTEFRELTSATESNRGEVT